jgi:GNAT superfamily N-acetyltransferase
MNSPFTWLLPERSNNEKDLDLNPEHQLSLELIKGMIGKLMDHKTHFQSVKYPEAQNYRYLFSDYPYFETFIDYVFEHTQPEIHVNSLENPQAAYFYWRPIYLFTGDPAKVDHQAVYAEMADYSWIVAENDAWSQTLKTFFGDKLITHIRTLFDSSKLNLDHVQSQMRPVPDGLRVTAIGPDQTQQESGLFYKDILRRFFVDTDFLETGYGFCVMDGDKLAGFAAANFPIREKVLEIYVRVLDEPQYRQKGLGITLSAKLIEYCLKNGITPVWDSANDISAHMAKKLGFVPSREWEMHQVRFSPDED